MKNKGFLLSLFIAGSLTANAQDIKEWLSLTPIKMEKPALSHVKNVKDQVFTDAMLTDFSFESASGTRLPIFTPE